MLKIDKNVAVDNPYNNLGKKKLIHHKYFK